MALPYHEPTTELSTHAREIHRAIATLVEELEAVDWYHQRVDVTGDEPLKAMLVHNRNEEIEHAAMALEWLRRHMPEFDEQLHTYLFTSAPITELEDADKEGPEAPTSDVAARGDLGIGKLGG